MTTAGQRDELVHVSAINSFVYCPRRYYYLRFYDVTRHSVELTEGRHQHQRHTRRGGQVRELYLRSDELGLHGKVDAIEDGRDGAMTPIERKRAESGGVYLSDRLQLAGYCMLLEERVGEPVNVGYVYTRSTDTRHAITISDEMRDGVERIVEKIRSMEVGKLPPYTQHPDKCESCSVRHYCLPAETRELEPEKVAGSGWEQ
ncbi:CRISPR-associated protein Cas4 [Salinigranum rubrum]|uniref:CRISPR-associated exonuclease Cas4 n=1 Tax=Salinigranum rubrum TaxID=755307 RepID=A0A2I8VLY6_9EURY|nr:CRISPR-associated protein Cas4 [Salinigranum rubrum]AUV82905.1 CRISPR-associated protein Cas4 [Salinigranum rubrum]